MDIPLTPQLQRFINEKVSAGEYPDAGKVVAAALRKLRNEERDTASDLAALKRKVAAGVRELDRGEGQPWNAAEIKAEGRRLLVAQKAAATKRAR